MKYSRFVSIGLLGAASASPVAHPDATITPAPTLVERQDMVATTYAVSSCYIFQDPDQGEGTGCQCSGYDGVLPFTTDGSSTCDYTQYVTSVSSTSSNGYPFTTTEVNGDVIAYAASTIYFGTDPADAVGVGASTTVFTAPTPTTTVEIGSQLIRIGDLGGGSTNWTDPLTSALQALCPSTDTVCDQSSTQSIETTYYGDDGSYGHIDVQVLQSNYSSPDEITGLIASVVYALGKSASNTNCQFVYYERLSSSCPGSNGFESLRCDGAYYLDCGSASFASAQILQDRDGSPMELGQLNVQLSYANDNPELWDCVSLLRTLGMAVGLLPGVDVVAGPASFLIGSLAFTCQDQTASS